MKTKLHMNIDAKLKEQLQALAARDNRNLTNFIEFMLSKMVADAEERQRYMNTADAIVKSILEG